MSETIKLVPSWEAAANMLSMVIRDGTDEGREEAIKEVVRMGKLLDELLKEKTDD